MEISVRYFTILSRITQKRHEVVKLEEGSTIEDMLAVLSERYGDELKRFFPSRREKKGLQLVFLLNGQNIAQSNGLKTRLHVGDTVAVLPPLAGG